MFEPSYYYPNTLKIVDNFIKLAISSFQTKHFNKQRDQQLLNCCKNCDPYAKTSLLEIPHLNEIEKALHKTSQKRMRKVKKRPTTAPRIRQKFNYP
jgi:hypothetical protein